MKFKINQEKVVYDGYLQVRQAQLTVATFSGSTIEMERLVVDRGDSVGVLIYERDTDSFIFTKQFRYPAIAHHHEWLLEIVAGKIEAAEAQERTLSVHREIKEEVGYQVQKVQEIGWAYASPGASSERLFLFYAEVNSSDKVYEGGGVSDEMEDVALVKISRQDLAHMVRSNQINDAKSLMASQWYFMNETQQ